MLQTKITVLSSVFYETKRPRSAPSFSDPRTAATARATRATDTHTLSGLCLLLYYARPCVAEFVLRTCGNFRLSSFHVHICVSAYASSFIVQLRGPSAIFLPLTTPDMLAHFISNYPTPLITIFKTKALVKAKGVCEKEVNKLVRQRERERDSRSAI